MSLLEAFLTAGRAVPKRLLLQEMQHQSQKLSSVFGVFSKSTEAIQNQVANGLAVTSADVTATPGVAETQIFGAPRVPISNPFAIGSASARVFSQRFSLPQHWGTLTSGRPYSTLAGSNEGAPMATPDVRRVHIPIGDLFPILPAPSPTVTSTVQSLLKASQSFAALSAIQRAQRVQDFATAVSESTEAINLATAGVHKDAVQQSVDRAECVNVTQLYAQDMAEQVREGLRDTGDYPSGVEVLSPPYNFAAILVMMMHQCFTENKAVVILKNAQNAPLVELANTLAKKSGFEALVHVMDIREKSRQEIQDLVTQLNTTPGCTGNRFTGHGDTMVNANIAFGQNGIYFDRSAITGEGNSPGGNYAFLDLSSVRGASEKTRVLDDLMISKAGYKGQKCSSTNVLVVPSDAVTTVRAYFATHQERVQDFFNSPDLVMPLSETKWQQIHTLLDRYNAQILLGDTADQSATMKPLVLLAPESSHAFLAQEFQEMFGPVLVITTPSKILDDAHHNNPKLTDGFYAPSNTVEQHFKDIVLGKNIRAGNEYVGCTDDPSLVAGTTAAEEQLGFSGPHGPEGSRVSVGFDTRPMGKYTIRPHTDRPEQVDYSRPFLGEATYRFLTEGSSPLDPDAMNAVTTRFQSRPKERNVDLLPLRKQLGVQLNSPSPNPAHLMFLPAQTSDTVDTQAFKEFVLGAKLVQRAKLGTPLVVGYHTPEQRAQYETCLQKLRLRVTFKPLADIQDQLATGPTPQRFQMYGNFEALCQTQPDLMGKLQGHTFTFDTQALASSQYMRHSVVFQSEKTVRAALKAGLVKQQDVIEAVTRRKIQGVEPGYRLPSQIETGVKTAYMLHYMHL